ncbi:MAG: 4-demethylwyosine synthase TYW1 [Candidatus Micrarchaeota archaeon]
MINPEHLKKFISAQYKLAGKHSAVQICSWTKKALRGEGVCYKQKFYGIDCHRCCQMSPAFLWCQQSCVHCWRPAEWMKKSSFPSSGLDSPEIIIEKSVQARNKLISGFGNPDVGNRKMFDEMFRSFPSHWAISLSGEPTIYPKIGALVKELRKHREVRSIFIVTNGQEPARLAAMARSKCLPTQLYVSLSASNEAAFRKLNKSTYKDGWKRLLRTLKMLGRLKCRTVVRLTLMKGINDSEEAQQQFAKLLEMAQADFIEVKSYMFLGQSRKRLKKENMPFHPEVVAYSKQLAKLLPSYKIEAEDTRSCIVLLKRKKSKVSNIISKA